MTSPEDAAAVVGPLLAGLDREHLLALLLDTSHRLLAIVTVSIGSIDQTFMSPREIFRDALLCNASALVLAHNHPSGDPEPSLDDVAGTQIVLLASEFIAIDMLDHLVVGDQGRWVSLARRAVI